jgi:hypothetical protein
LVRTLEIEELQHQEALLDALTVMGQPILSPPKSGEGEGLELDFFLLFVDFDLILQKKIDSVVVR